MKRFAIAGLTVLLLTLTFSLGSLQNYLRAYLFSFLFWSDLPIGAMVLLMIYFLTGGEWGKIVSPILSVISRGLLLCAVLFIPIAANTSHIYPWEQATRHSYLNQGSFICRSIFYFLCWGFLSFFIRQWKDHPEKLRKLGAGGLVLVLFTVSFASVDWQMSIEPKWSSSLYGLIFLVGEALTAYSFVLMTLANRRDISPKVGRDLGNLLLAMVMVWAYLSFMQYLIIWCGNLPREVTWYQMRTTQTWQWIALTLFLFQFVGPFLFLLFRKNKEDVRTLAFVAALVFCFRILDHYFMLTPGFGFGPSNNLLNSVLTFAGIGLLWMSVTHLKHGVKNDQARA